MLSIDFTFLFTLLNLIILYFFVKRFLFSKLGAFMDKRSADIAQDIEQGKALIAQGEEYRQQHEDVLQKTEEERRGILEKAQRKAEADCDEMINQAKKETSRILQEARQAAEREKLLAQQEARTQIAALAISAASKVIEQNMDTARNQELVNNFLDKEAHL